MRHLFDARTQLKDAGLVGATANVTVGGVAKILDVGNARMDATLVLDVSAIETGTGDEHYWILLQGSSDSAFGSDIVNLAIYEYGHLSTLVGSPSAAPTVGRHELDFNNDFNGTYYRYIRIRVVVAGTVVAGINFTAFLGIDEL
jgi:hypothetical protein